MASWQRSSWGTRAGGGREWGPVAAGNEIWWRPTLLSLYPVQVMASRNMMIFTEEVLCNAGVPGTTHHSHCSWLASELHEGGEGGVGGGAGVGDGNRCVGYIFVPMRGLPRANGGTIALARHRRRCQWISIPKGGLGSFSSMV